MMTITDLIFLLQEPNLISIIIGIPILITIVLAIALPCAYFFNFIERRYRRNKW